MSFRLIQISEAQFEKLGQLITKEVGIKLPPEKRIMFQSRMQSHLNRLGFESFDTYIDYFFKPENVQVELSSMIDLISTNKTDFFRENEHFELLRDSIFPELFEEGAMKADQFLKCWSAGSSNGQEAFSLAMTIEEYKHEYGMPLNYYILGTDVSTRMLNTAKKGIYPFECAQQIPPAYLKNYVLKSKDTSSPRIKMMNSIQSKVEFRYSNLMELNYDIPHQFQIIFLRNTLIYFDQENQFQVLKRVLSKLVPGGFLFIGHSESLINLDLPLKVVSPSVYQKNN